MHLIKIFSNEKINVLYNEINYGCATTKVCSNGSVDIDNVCRPVINVCIKHPKLKVEIQDKNENILMIREFSTFSDYRRLEIKTTTYTNINQMIISNDSSGNYLYPPWSHFKKNDRFIVEEDNFYILLRLDTETLEKFKKVTVKLE
jgi:hypothetical protein